MPRSPDAHIVPLDAPAGVEPAAVIARWDASGRGRGDPCMALVSGRTDDRFGRWSVLARPVETYRLDRSAFETSGSGNARRDAARDVLRTFLAASHVPTIVAPAIDRLERPPFVGGSIVTFSYELGAMLEPHASLDPPPRADADAWPLALVARCPGALVHDRVDDRWFGVGDDTSWRPLLPLIESPSDPIVTREHLDHVVRSTVTPDDDDYRAIVARTVEFVLAGDVFQANVARRFEATLACAGDSRSAARAFALDLLARSGAWYGALLEWPEERTIASASPELFLRIEPDAEHGARVVTRPIKGTRPVHAVDASQALLASAKDAAELAMIVDLMRNDLGRVARLGSVRVDEARAIETHPTVHHGVAEVSARLRPEIDLADLLAATFPPGSITGAPKVRAMQIIEALERRARGPYCGAIGFVSADGRAQFDVSIRTATMRPSAPGGASPRSLEIEWGAGCGIVAESDPDAECAESHAKARVFLDALPGVASTAPERA